VEQEGGKGDVKVFYGAPSNHGFQWGLDRYGNAGSVVEGFFKVM
jgi:hypothetical protein